MNDRILLSFLCNWPRERRNKLSTGLAVLKKRQNIEPSNLKLRDQITEKERELALVGENKIAEYSSHWVALPKHSHRPCPLCFIHGETSYLIGLPEENSEEPFKCESCKEKFYIPMEK